MESQLQTPTEEQLAAETGIPVRKFFSFAHLPPVLRDASEPWCRLAMHIVATVARSPERTVALRKLLEGKDAAVRACLP